MLIILFLLATFLRLVLLNFVIFVNPKNFNKFKPYQNGKI